MSITFNYDEAVTKCVVQLLLIGVIRDLLEEHFTKFTKEVPYLCLPDVLIIFIAPWQIGSDPSELVQLCSYLQRIYFFALLPLEEWYPFIVSLQYSLYNSGFMKDMAQLPGLLKQEKEALAIQTMLLCKKYHSAVDETAKKELLNQFLE